MFDARPALKALPLALAAEGLVALGIFIGIAAIVLGVLK